MKVVEIQGNQCIRLFKPSPPVPPDNVKALNFIRGIESRYGFFQGPRTIADVNLQSGVAFLRGQFKNRWFIEKFQLFNHGITAEAKVATDELDEFLDDATSWARQQLGFSEREFDFGARLYLSQIEVEIDLPFDAAFARFEEFGAHLAALAKSYGRDGVPNFGVSDFRLAAGAGELVSDVAGADFIFARKAGTTKEANRYFSSAPVKTADHLKLLDELVSVFNSMKADARQRPA